jgi:hypothetical protein
MSPSHPTNARAAPDKRATMVIADRSRCAEGRGSRADRLRLSAAATGTRIVRGESLKSSRNGAIMPRSESDCHIQTYRWYGKGRLFLLSASPFVFRVVSTSRNLTVRHCCDPSSQKIWDASSWTGRNTALEIRFLPGSQANRGSHCSRNSQTKEISSTDFWTIRKRFDASPRFEKDSVARTFRNSGASLFYPVMSFDIARESNFREFTVSPPCIAISRRGLICE